MSDDDENPAQSKTGEGRRLGRATLNVLVKEDLSDQLEGQEYTMYLLKEEHSKQKDQPKQR